MNANSTLLRLKNSDAMVNERPHNMRRSRTLVTLAKFGLLAAFAVCTSFLAACSGVSQGSSFVSPGSAVSRQQESPAVQLFISRTSTTPATFAAEYNKKDIAILNASNQRIATISDQGIPATDKTGLLYIEDPNSNHVHVYSPPYTGKPTAITFGTEQVHSLAVYSSTGMFAVTTQVRKDGSGRVNFFRRGETAPCNIVDVPPNFPDEAGSAFDAEGNLFLNVSNQSSSGQSLIASASGGCVNDESA